MSVTIHFYQTFTGSANSTSFSVSLSNVAPANSSLYVAIQTEATTSLNSISAGGRSYQILSSTGYGTQSGKGSWALISAGSGGIPSGTSIGFTFSAKVNRYVGYIFCLSGFSTFYEEAFYASSLGAAYQDTNLPDNILTLMTVGVNKNYAYTHAAHHRMVEYPLVVAGGSSSTAPRIVAYAIGLEHANYSGGNTLMAAVKMTGGGINSIIWGYGAEQRLYRQVFIYNSTVGDYVYPENTEFAYRAIHFIASDVYTFRGAGTQSGIAPFVEYAPSQSEVINPKFNVWDSSYDPLATFPQADTALYSLPGKRISSIYRSVDVYSSSTGTYITSHVPHPGSEFLVVRSAVGSERTSTVISPTGKNTDIPHSTFGVLPTVVSSSPGDTLTAVLNTSLGAIASNNTTLQMECGPTDYSLGARTGYSFELGPLQLTIGYNLTPLGGSPSRVLVRTSGETLALWPVSTTYGANVSLSMGASEIEVDTMKNLLGLALSPVPIEAHSTNATLTLLPTLLSSGHQSTYLGSNAPGWRVLTGLMRFVAPGGIEGGIDRKPCYLVIGSEICLDAVDVIEVSTDFDDEKKSVITELRVGFCVASKDTKMLGACAQLKVGSRYPVAYAMGLTEFSGLYRLDDMSSATTSKKVCYDLILRRELDAT